MAVTIKIAKTPEEIDGVFQIRHKVFFEEENLLEASPSGRLMDRFDAFPTTWNLIVQQDERIIGSLRMSVDSPVGLPADEYFNFRPLLPDNARLMHLGMFCVSCNYRSSKITVGLMLMAAYFGMSHNVTHVLAPINPAIVRMIKRVGFEQVGEEFTEKHTGAKMIPLILDVNNLSDFFMHFVKENQMLDSIGEYNRAFYEKGETIIKSGDPGNQAFIIIEGSAEVRLPGKEETIDILNQGDVFGELALIFDEKRTADVIAAEDLQVMTLSKEAFDRMFFNDPRNSLQLVKILANRNREMLGKLNLLRKNL